MLLNTIVVVVKINAWNVEIVIRRMNENLNDFSRARSSKSDHAYSNNAVKLLINKF